jgi:hypothetical protein
VLFLLLIAKLITKLTQPKLLNKFNLLVGRGKRREGRDGALLVDEL